MPPEGRPLGEDQYIILFHHPCWLPIRRTHQDTQDSAQGFSSPYQNILSGSTQTAQVPSLHTLSEPLLLQGHDPFHYEIDPLGEAPGSWSGATASGYPVSYSPRCLPVSSGLGLKGWLRILHRVFATFVPMDAAMRGFGWSVLPSAEAVCKLADVGRKPRKDCSCLLPFPRCCRERMQSTSRDCSTSMIPACVSAGCFYPRGLATFPWKQRRP